MFRWLRLLTLALALAPTFAHAGIAKLCEGKNFGTCFQLLLQGRCVKYAQGNLFSKREYFCEHSVVRMMDLLEPLQPKDDPDHVIAFPKLVNELIHDAEAFAYLRDLPGAIEKSIEEGQLFGFWDFTVARAGSEDRALKWIAVLFQDTHPDENIVIAETKLTATERETWAAAIEAFSYDRLADRSAESDAVFFVPYPNIDPTFLSEGTYHFYLSAYVAREVQRARKSTTEAGRDMNAFAPFLMNTMYEMQADQDPDKSPLRDAKPFSAVEMDHSLRDTYSGYVGALYGIGGKALVAKAEPYSTFSKRYAKDPSGTMRSLYRSFVPKK